MGKQEIEYGKYLIKTRKGRIYLAERECFFIDDIWNIDQTGGLCYVKDEDVVAWKK